MKRTKKESDAVGRSCIDTHKRTHLGVWNLGYSASAAVFAKMGIGEIKIKVGLDFSGIAFEENESANGGDFLAMNALFAVLLEIANGFVYKKGLLVFG